MNFPLAAEITIDSYFGNVTSSLFALTIVRKIYASADPKQYRLGACLHGGGGPQVGEVTLLGGLKQ